jgi:GalNAc-alpha-(1->4)-GalNAc-alpha-(1->3)-diNAcBac-PP-undecaprenol alpha-1,4-N-acetyl-D-galactosaminyltransferase
MTLLLAFLWKCYLNISPGLYKQVVTSIANRVRITFVISSLGGGGAERAAAVMANYWAEKGWQITILAINSGRPPAYDLHTDVVYHEMRALLPARSPGLPQDRLARLINDCSKAERAVLIAELGLILALRHATSVTAPEMIISFLDITNIQVLLATYDADLPVIVTEHSDPFHNSIGEGRESLRRRLYPKAKYVTVLTEEAARYFSATAGDRVRVIPNPLGAPGLANEKARGARPTLLAMGRLSPEKGFDLLLRAFARIAERHSRWDLEIWGEGALGPYLTELADELGLAERVRLPGFTRNPYEVMRRAELFAVSSLCEGFSNVLVEAMACGLAAVSFDCPSGPRHIIRDGVDGVLVPPRDVVALAAALDQLMGDEVERHRLAIRAAEVIDRFGVNRVMRMWEALVLSQCV